MTVQDRRFAAMTAVCVLFCALFPFVVRPVFEKLFADYYGLPALTELALTTWFPLVMGLVPALVGGVAVAGKMPRVLRLAFALGIVASAVCIGSMVLPSLRSDDVHAHG